MHADLTQIISFLDSDQRNAWIRSGNLQVYLRKARHIVNGIVYSTFDIPNVLATNKKLSGKGEFRSLLADVALLLRYNLNFDAIFIENVCNERLAISLASIGYTRIEGVIDPSFFKKLR